MHHYQTRSVGALWLALTSDCLRVGSTVHDGPQELRELLQVAFVVTDPTTTDEADDWFDRTMISSMHDNFHSLTPQFGYKVSYGERIWTPENASPYGYVRDILRRKPEAKSATLTLLLPGDHKLGHVPCITSIDFKIRDGQLHVSYFARSQDLFKKNYADNLAIHEIGQMLAADLGVGPGPLSALIVSGHVYAEDADRIRAVAPLREDADRALGPVG